MRGFIFAQLIFAQLIFAQLIFAQLKERDYMSLTLRAARRHVAAFANECDIMKSHHEAMECLDCDNFLRVGIEAFQWLVRADEAIRCAVYEGMEYDSESDEIIQKLFREWLAPCEWVNKWIAVHQERGNDLTNLDEFRKCEQEVRSIIKSLDADAMTEPIRKLRDAAIQDHRNGETAEFV